MLRRMLRPALPALGLVLLAMALVASGHDEVAAADDATGRPDQVVLTISPIAGGPALRTVGGSYLSPVSEAARPFTHMLLRWEASEPVSDTLTLEVRASLDGQHWTDWGPVPENPDLWVPEDGDQVYWSQTIYAGEGARFWQVRATPRPAPNGRLPELRRIDVNTVDARFGDDRPDADNGPQPAAAQGLSSVAKPAVVSRSGWGCPDGQGSRARPVYFPVRHMVVHHTADSNSLTGSEQSWADRVRAEWSFHTFSRGWGDVGYNYLIDPDGVVYEGRAGGDDTVAFHDTANYGSMGVVLMGTFANVDPRPAAVDGLVELLAWKAGQKGIDPLGRSYYYGCAISKYCAPFHSGALVLNISGHRQVTPGHTSCPGDRLLGVLPAVRNRVKERLSGGGDTPTRPDDGDLIVDELESSFARSPASWYEASCGYGDHTFYSYTTDSQAESSNSATWRPTIPSAGRYRVYAYIPRGCGLGAATTRAVYRIAAADGSYQATVNQSSAEEWAYLGTYNFSQGSGGAVELYDFPGEPYSQRRVIYFDSVKWVPEPASASIELLDVAFDRTTVAAGELLKVTFTVRNPGSTPVYGQEPQAAQRGDGSFDTENPYVYQEDECFLGAPGRDYAAYPKETDRFRVMLGPVERSVSCAGGAGDDAVGYYPWRWGVNGRLDPGETRQVVGYVRFSQPGSVTLQAGVIREYVAYGSTRVRPTTITVTPERHAPVPISYDGALQPLARVYTMGAAPDNLLARSRDPLAIPNGAYVGSFAWDGSTQDWGEGGPLDQSDGFIVEQTRVFMAPVSGEYTFRTYSDDGSWLWVDGQEVVANYGLHDPRTVTGTITLEAGPHVLALRYFERTGAATVGYAVMAPGSGAFAPPIDGLGGGAPRAGGTFARTPNITIAADDHGGSGVAMVRYSWDGELWVDLAGGVVPIGRMADGSYTLRYQVQDAEGNWSEILELAFSVDSSLFSNQVYQPIFLR